MPDIGIHLSLFIMSIRSMNGMRYIWLKVNQSSSDWSISRGRVICQGMESSRSFKLKNINMIYQIDYDYLHWYMTVPGGRLKLRYFARHNWKQKTKADLGPSFYIYTGTLKSGGPTTWNEIRHSLSNITCKGFILSKVYTYLYSIVCSKILNKSP